MRIEISAPIVMFATLAGGLAQPALGEDLCDSLGKPAELYFDYVPGNVLDTQQGNKAWITNGGGGGLDGDNSIYVVVSKSSEPSDTANVHFTGTILKNGEFIANDDSWAFGSATYLHFFDEDGGALLQTVQYHTSCSAPITLGDVLGNATMTGMVNESGTGAFLPPTIEYSCVGFEPPADNALAVRKPNRVLPLRMKLVDADGMGVWNIAPPVVSVSYVASDGDDPVAVEELTYAGNGDEGNRFLFNDDKWAFNLSTRGLASGEYTVSVVPGANDYVISPSCEVIVNVN
jgi:hypothetical protein